MNSKQLIILLAFLILGIPSIYSKKVSEQQRNVKAIQEQVKNIYPKLLESTVNIENGGTGVIVSEDGYILTANHIIMGVGGKKELNIKLADGSNHIAVCLGRSHYDDYALLKVKEDGKWPYTKMGNSGELVKDEACVLLGHPEAYEEGRSAVLRVGFVDGVTSAGFLRTSAIMMPGDSGGPLFNLKGELIGINCYCWQPEDENYFAPVNKIKGNWEKLVAGEVFNPIDPNNPPYKAKGFTKAPLKEDNFVLNNGKTGLSKFVASNINSQCYGVYKLYKSSPDTVLLASGTLINSEGIVVSKSSLVKQDTILCKVKSEFMTASVVKRSVELDLVYLKIENQSKDFMPIHIEQDEKVGSFLATIGEDGDVMYTGVMAVNSRNIPQKQYQRNYGMLGVKFSDDIGTVKSVHEKSGAYRAGLRAGDRILSINKEKLYSSNEIKDYLKRTYPYERIKIEVERKGEPQLLQVMLGAPSHDPILAHPAFKLRTNLRKSNFSSAFTHDMPIKPLECGTPVINVKGEIVGINIARKCRTSSYAIPIEEVLEAL